MGRETKHKRTAFCRSYRGIALIVSMVFVVVFSALAISLGTMSATNLRIADNHRQVNRAIESAQSGLELMRYWLSSVVISITVSDANRFETVVSSLESDLDGTGIGVERTYDEDTLTAVTVGNIMLDSASNQTCSIVVETTNDVDVLQVDISGTAAAVERTIRVNYNFGTRANTVFDYGMATKGALYLAGNIELTGTKIDVDASVYIESEQEPALSIIGNSSIAGDASITDPDAVVTMQGGQASIGGQTGQAAIDNHVHPGVPPADFPAPDPGYFEQYVQNTYDPNLTVFENIRIPAGTNPTFASGVTLNGIVFIEVPNVVTFSGGATITGIIVGDGDVSDSSWTNRIMFNGSVTSYPVGDLPADEPQFDGLRDEIGTFILAPGFGTFFYGNFETLNGAIASNGIGFFGNSGGTVTGSIINYGIQPLVVSGNSDIVFNRTSSGVVPAGFKPELILWYVPGSYSEPL